MQLLSIVLYNHDGRVRTVDFVPGALNIVTGESQTGKSALLTIVEFCLGRDKVLTPVGPISETVAWYATLWQLADTRAFVARPAPAAGRASTTQAMLEFGTTLEAPDLAQLQVNTDSDRLREQLGRRIGIEENLSEPEQGSLRAPLEANLGHAALLCLQSQNEIASATTLFHRQGEAGVDQALRDTIPYFLGAVALDEAAKRAMLRDAKRNVARISGELARAESAANTIEVELTALLVEAQAVGLVDDAPVAGRLELVNVLQTARTAAPQPDSRLDLATQDRRSELEVHRQNLTSTLHAALDDRGLLLRETQSSAEFTDAVGQQQGRLLALDLLAPEAHGPDSAAEHAHQDDAPADAAGSSTELLTCPACRSTLTDPDPTAAALRNSLVRLTAQVGEVTEARPARRLALTGVDERITSLRSDLRATNAAVVDLDRGSEIAERAHADTRDFTRGRIDATLERAALTDDTHLQVLRQQLRRAEGRVAALEAELDEDNSREQLTSRLATVGRSMSDYADRLALEHSGDSVRLDLVRLTAVADTPTGPVPLFRIGSAANWIGYHLAAHLALHQFFATQDRPVPRFLMLDQPTQAHYPSDTDNAAGEPDSDADRLAVRQLFALMRDVVADLTPNFQVIVCDHADLPEDWFKDAVRHRWRDGVKLIPADWLDPAAQS